MDDKFSNEHKHKDKTASSLLYAAITVGLIIPLILLIPLFIILGVGGNPAIFLLFIIAFACVGLSHHCFQFFYCVNSGIGAVKDFHLRIIFGGVDYIVV